MDYYMLFYILNNFSRLFSLIYITVFSILGILFITAKAKRKFIKVLIWILGLFMLIFSVTVLFQIANVIIR